jgi:membrane associated rhomboid family serine protease
MIVNVLGFIAVRLVPELGERLALVPSVCLHDHAWWRLVTYLGVHYSALHLFVDLAGLWMFGRLLESTWGARRLLTYFALCGVSGGVFVLLLDPHGAGTVGPTAAVMGIIAALAWLYPDAMVLLFSVVPLRARWAFLLFAALHGALCFQGSVWDGHWDAVAHLALTGGVLVGWLHHRYTWLGMVWLHKLSKALRGQPARRAVADAGIAAGPVSPGPVRLRPRVEEPLNHHRLDAILDKIAQEGMASLTADERQWLQQASRRLREADQT